MIGDWLPDAKALMDQGITNYTEIARRLGVKPNTVIKRLINLNGKKNTQITTKHRTNTTTKPDIITLLKSMTTIDEVAQNSGMSRRMVIASLEDLKDSGYNIYIDGENVQMAKQIATTVNTIKKDWDGERTIRIGLMGDNQSASKYTQITHLNDFYDRMQSEGIKDIYHTGDIDEGDQMRQGHQFECYVQGADDHVEEIVKNYPMRKGITTHFITGNHDHSILKRAGHDIGVSISKQRSDMKYLGQSQASIYLTPNCKLDLNHPCDGTAYAISYKIQKMIEALSGGEKPSIMATGHYHKAEYIFYRNIHSIQTGCFQAQTSWMRGKGIAAMIGGWLVDISVTDEGEITKFTPTFFPYYKAIAEDYKNWR